MSCAHLDLKSRIRRAPKCLNISKLSVDRGLVTPIPQSTRNSIKCVINLLCGCGRSLMWHDTTSSGVVGVYAKVLRSTTKRVYCPRFEVSSTVILATFKTCLSGQPLSTGLGWRCDFQDKPLAVLSRRCKGVLPVRDTTDMVLTISHNNWYLLSIEIII